MSLHIAIESGISGNQVSNQVNLMNGVDIQIEVNRVLKDGNQVSTITGGIAGGIAEFALIGDNMAFRIIEQLDRGIANDIAGGIDNK